MSLLNSMLQFKMDLLDMRRWACSKCKNKKAQKDLLNLLSSEQQKVEEFDTLVIQGKYQQALHKISDHIFPRQEGWFIRKNYDYGEAWNELLDEFREGEIKNVVEMARKLRRWDQEDDEKYPNEKDATLKMKDLVAMFERKAEDGDSTIPTEAYCGKKRNIEYWKEMSQEDEEYNEAIEDFINYIQEIKC